MDAARQLGGAAGQALTGAVATGGVAMAGIAASKLFDAATKSRDYRAMLAANPEVQEFARESPNQANAMFTSLRNLNPAYSKDPFVAGHFMRQMAAAPNDAGGYLMVATQDRAKFDHPVLETYLKGSLEGVKPRSAQSLPWGAPPGSGQRGGPPRGPGGAGGVPPYPTQP